MTESAGTQGPPHWREHWFPLAFRRDLAPDRIERVDVLDRALALFLDGAGTPAALVDRCPHRSARLSDGRVRDGLVECLYHGWRFDRTGSCVELPQKPRDTSSPPGNACAAPVPLRVEQGIVWAWGGEPERASSAAPPTIAALDSDRVSSIDFTMDLPYGQDYFVENVLDVAHIHVAHAGTRGGGDRRLAGPLEFEIEREDAAGFAASFRTAGLAEAPRTRGLRRARVEFRAPSLVHYVSEFEDSRHVSGLALYSLPRGPGASRMLYRAYGNRWTEADLRRPRWVEHLSQCFLLEEDMAVVRGQAEEIDRSSAPLAEMWRPLRSSDRLVVRYREWVERHAPDRPGAIGMRDIGARGVLSSDAKLDRWTLHTRHCADCRAAHARLTRRSTRWSVLAVTALACAAAAGGPLAWASAALALGGFGLAKLDRHRSLQLVLERDPRSARPPAPVALR